MDVLLSRQQKAELKALLRNGNFSYSVLYNDLQEEIEKEAVNMQNARRAAHTENVTSWTFYPDLEEVESFMSDMVRKFPKLCSVFSIGLTAHDRDIKVLKISNGGKLNYRILIESGAHAREWEGVLANVYTIYHVLQNWTDFERYRMHDWFFIPVLNPDGYHHTHTKDRMWRKNRRILTYACYGVDVNKNFPGRDWCTFPGSHDMCAEYFCGAVPWSEHESQAVRTLQRKYNFYAYLSIHGPGTAVSYPWLWSTAPSKDYRYHMIVASAMVTAINSFQDHVHFLHGWPDWLGAKPITGTSLDWLYSQGISHSFIINYPEKHHFPPEDQIMIVNEIIFVAIEAMVQLI